MERRQRRSLWVLGLAGLGRNVGWGMNKVFTAALLGLLTPSTQLIGTVLGMEGFFGLVLNPLTGYLSDHAPGPAGRRRPYLFVAFPGAAIALVYFYFSHTLSLAVAAVLVFYFFQQLSPTPYQAMMPDSVENSEYGEASGILNLLWSGGNLIAFLVVPVVFEYVSHTAGFVLGAAILLLGGLWTAFGTHEAPVLSRGRTASIRPLVTGQLLKFYVAQGLWWLGFEAIASFFTLYVIHALGGTAFDSAIGMSIFTVAGIAVALWFGRLYDRRDARTLLAGCLALFAVVSLTGLVVGSVTEVFVLLFVAGIAWGGIQVTSYPLAADILHRELQRSGHSEETASAEARELHGGLYGGVNLVQSVALLVAAPLAGWAIALEHDHYQVMFVVSAASLFVSLALVLVLGPVRTMTPTPVMSPDA